MDNPHFEIASTWAEAVALVEFEPAAPSYTHDADIRSFAVYVRDYKDRELPRSDRSLEIFYDGFVFSQARKGRDEARRLAFEVSYGQIAKEAGIGGLWARVYELGPEPGPGDIDGRSPAVVVWADGEMLYLIASDVFDDSALLEIAGSIY